MKSIPFVLYFGLLSSFLFLSSCSDNDDNETDSSATLEVQSAIDIPADANAVSVLLVRGRPPTTLFTA